MTSVRKSHANPPKQTDWQGLIPFFLTRIIHESAAPTADMGVLPGVLGCRTLRRTVQVCLGPIPRYRGTVARWHTHLHGLAPQIHE